MRGSRERNEGGMNRPLPGGAAPPVPAHIPHQIVKRQDRRATRDPALRRKIIQDQLKRPRITARTPDSQRRGYRLLTWRPGKDWLKGYTASPASHLLVEGM